MGWVMAGKGSSVISKRTDIDKGFTLIDLIIALAIAAILVAIAAPMYSDMVRKARRVDAVNGLMQIHLAQARHRAGNSTYASRLSDLGWAADVAESTDGYYHLRIVPVQGNNNAYMALAEPNPATDQRYDACRRFVLNQDGPDLVNSTAAHCWAR